MKTTDIKTAIYKNGSSIKYLAECDLITQDNKNRDEAIYLIDVSFIKDPRTQWTQADTDRINKRVAEDFKYNNFSFKAANRSDADKYIAFHNTGWDVIQDFTSIVHDVKA